MDITGKIALITGGASGIGAAICETFAKAGGHVIVSDINVEGGEKVAKSITESGGTASFLQLDVTDEASVEAATASIEKEHGKLDIFVSGAGPPDAGGYPFDDGSGRRQDRHGQQ